MIELGLVNAPAIKKIPLPFSFTDVTATPNLNTIVETSIIPVGFEGNADATVTGNDAAIRVNNTGAWDTTARLAPGDLLNLRMTASAAFNTELTANVTIYGVSDLWNLKTCTNPNLSFTAVNSTVISTVYYTSANNYSNANLAMAVVSGNGSVSSDNTNWGSSANITSGQLVYLKQTSASNGSTESTLTVSAIGNNYEWDITTVAGVTPPNLDFYFPSGDFGNNTTKAYISRANPFTNSVIWYQGSDTNASNASIQFTITSNAEYARISNTGWNNWVNTVTVASGQWIWINVVSSNTNNTTVRSTVSGAGYSYNVDITTTHPNPNWTFNSSNFQGESGQYVEYTDYQQQLNSCGYTMLISADDAQTTVSNDNVTYGSSTIVANGVTLYTKLTVIGIIATGGVGQISSNTGYQWSWSVMFAASPGGA
jgi:hypothetical protein